MPKEFSPNFPGLTPKVARASMEKMVMTMDTVDGIVWACVYIHSGATHHPSGEPITDESKKTVYDAATMALPALFSSVVAYQGRVEKLELLVEEATRCLDAIQKARKNEQI